MNITPVHRHQHTVSSARKLHSRVASLVSIAESPKALVALPATPAHEPRPKSEMVGASIYGLVIGSLVQVNGDAACASDTSKDKVVAIKVSGLCGSVVSFAGEVAKISIAG